MIRGQLSKLLLIATVLVSPLQAATIESFYGEGSFQQKDLTVDGVNRSYYLYTPKGVEGPSKTLLVFHGGGGNANLSRLYGYESLADLYGFRIVYPQGINNMWNVGLKLPKMAPDLEKIDDLSYFDNMLEDLNSKGLLNPDKVFATGNSMGGYMSFYLSCHRTDKLTAIAPVVASMLVEIAESCQPSKPLPVLLTMGTEDKSVPFKGGELGGPQNKLLSYSESLNFWAKANGCNNSRAATLFDLDSNDGIQTYATLWNECRNNVSVKGYQVDGMGHRLPGTKTPDNLQELLSVEIPADMDEVLGKQTFDYFGAAEIWYFFQQY